MIQEESSRDGCGIPVLPLDVGHLRFHFHAPRGVWLGDFNASAWRGVLGHALRRTACVTGQRSCAGCLLRNGCAYSDLFESPPPTGADRMRRYTAVPHPLIIRNVAHSGRREEGASVTLEVLLLGKARVHLPFLVHAFDRAGQRGFGRERWPLSLNSVAAWQAGQGWLELWREGEGLASWSGSAIPPLPPLPAAPLRIGFLTPLRLVRQGQTIDSRSLRPVDLWRSLTRRIAMLCYFHGAVDLTVDFAALHRQAERLDWLHCDFRDCRWKRYSSRQRRLIALPGVVGSAMLDLSADPELWPWLWWGQWLHAGKATVMGLGQYRLLDGKLAAAENTGGMGHDRLLRASQGRGIAAGQGFKDERSTCFSQKERRP